MVFGWFVSGYKDDGQASAEEQQQNDDHRELFPVEFVREMVRVAISVEVLFSEDDGGCVRRRQNIV